jgi:hypothetical protein
MNLRNLCLAATLFTGSSMYATVITYVGTLSGANESPSTNSPGVGTALVSYNTDTQMMEVQLTFSDLTSPNTAAHIHCCTAMPFVGTAGVATVTPTFTGFPSNVTFGTYDHTFDLTQASSYNPAFVTLQGGSVANAEAALLAGLAGGTTYLNIHTGQNPGGEIRSFLIAVPEPASLGLVGLALVGLLAFGRKRRLSA